MFHHIFRFSLSYTIFPYDHTLENFKSNLDKPNGSVSALHLDSQPHKIAQENL